MSQEIQPQKTLAQATPAQETPLQENPMEIDVLEFSAWREDGRPHAILDVREPWEREICAFSGSLDIPMAEVPQRLAELPEGEALVVICHHGMRSRQVTQWLRAQGVQRATNLSGGIDAWARIVDRSMDLY